MQDRLYEPIRWSAISELAVMHGVRHMGADGPAVHPYLAALWCGE